MRDMFYLWYAWLRSCGFARRWGACDCELDHDRLIGIFNKKAGFDTHDD